MLSIMMNPPLPPTAHSSPSPIQTTVSAPSWIPVNVAVKTKRPRTSKPKVKTGCRTCKIRRVKCDEQKPSCRRCLRFNGECDGYEVDTARSAPKSIMPKLLASLAPKTIASTSPEPQIMTVVRDLRPLSSIESQEELYFQYFHEKTVPRLSTYLNESLWNRLVIQACESEPSIRHAVIAIGALDMAFEEGGYACDGNGPAPFQIGDFDNKSESHHQFAIQQYGKAIKRMRETLSEPRHDMKNTLIACLLFVCFETFLGQQNIPLDEAHSGLKLVNGWLPQFMTQGIIRTDPSLGPRSPSPYVIKDELVHAFARLDIVSLMLAKEKPTEIHSKLRLSVLEICQLMPQTFLSVEEARMYWDLMWKQTLHYVSNTTSWCPVLGLEDSDRLRPGEAWECSLNTGRGTISEREDDYLGGLLQWSSAFEPLFLDSQTLANQKDYIAATSLALQSKACHLAIAGAFHGEMYYDGYLKTSKEIVTLSDRLLSYIKDRGSASRAIFSFERMVARSVYMVARMCRDPITRRRAISILGSTPRREGTSENLLMAKIATISMEIEEDRTEGHFVPERARIKAVRTTFNMQERTGKLLYARARPEPGKEHVVEQIIFTW